MKVNQPIKPAVIPSQNKTILTAKVKTKKNGAIYLKPNTDKKKSLIESLANKTEELGDLWNKTKAINNEATKRGSTDSEYVLEILTKLKPEKLIYSAGKKVLNVVNAASSSLDVIGEFAKDRRNNTNYYNTIDKIVKATAQTMITSSVTAVATTALGGSALATLGAPVVIGVVIGGIAGYGFGKLYESSRNWFN